MASYHLEELRIALDSRANGDLMPPPAQSGERILDIGCGAGQTLIARYSDRVSFGIDPDISALRLGKGLSGRIGFACGRAEALPYADACFDMVVARVSLPYTDIGAALGEIRRVLRPGGRLWVLLHPLRIPLRNAWRTHSLKAWIFFAYIFLNGAVFHLFQKQFPFRGRFESFQTTHAMRSCLKENRFEIVDLTRSYAFAITARALN